MSTASAQAAAFYREVAENLRVWTVRDDAGFLTSTNSSGERAQPFWSLKSRAERIIQQVPAYAKSQPVEISWEEFCSEWLPDLARDGIKIGVNWSGNTATGYDIDPADLVANVSFYLQRPPGTPVH